MYEIYETEAFILEIKNLKESDQKILAFTKDFGFIWLNLSGGRNEKSKQKYFSQILSYSKLFLVKGKNGYRITGGELIKNIFFEKKENRQLRSKIFLDFLKLAQKFSLYNLEDNFLFSISLEFQNELLSTKKEFQKVETYFILKILKHFGYWDEEIKNIEEYKKKKNIKNDILKINEILRKIL